MNAALLARMRADCLRDLEETEAVATVRTATPETTELGGTSTTPADGASYPVNLQEDTQQPREAPAPAGNRVAYSRYLAFLPWNAEVKETDVLRIAGVDYQVIGTNGGETNRFSLRVRLILAQ
jgi:hypothetical protein